MNVQTLPDTVFAEADETLASRDPRLDRVARIAAMAMIAPIAFVCVFDEDDEASDRLPHIGGLFGMAHATALALCAQLGTGLLKQMLAADDAPLDALCYDEVADCTMVPAAYCNMPLLDPAGTVMGSLCVIDTRPRQWAVQEIEIMKDLAILAIDSLAEVPSVVPPPATAMPAEIDPSFLGTMPSWFIEHARVGLAMVDLQRRCLWANSAFECMLGIPLSSMLGLSVTELIKPLQEKGDIENAINLVLHEGKTQALEIRVSANASGPERFMSVNIYPVEHEDAITGASVLVAEISDRRKAECHVRYETERLMLACEAANIGIWYWDLRTDRIDWTAECREILGLNVADELSYQDFLGRLHPDDREATAQAVDAALTGCTDYHATYRIFLAEDRMRWIDARGRVFVDANGDASCFMGAVVDVTDLKEKEFNLQAKSEALLTLNDNLAEVVDARTAKLQLLSQSLIELAEKEKAELARELHDELGANLTVAHMEVVAALRQLNDRDSDLAKNLMRAREIILSTTMLKRRIIEGLRPSLLESLGLAESLRALVEQYSAGSQIHCITQIPEELPGLGHDLSLALYRITQESLTNVAKYAEASEVFIRIEQTGGSIVLEIADNGRGLPEDFRERATAHGISGMQQRAAQFKGVFSIMCRTDGPGTRVTVVIPCPM